VYHCQVRLLKFHYIARTIRRQEIPGENRNSQQDSSGKAPFSMFYQSAVRPILFSLDAEFAHERTLEMLSVAGKLPFVSSHQAFTHARLRACVAGIEFPNPIGLAAGCDKNGKAIPIWPRFGFGFVEVGTITAQPQPGNPRPRVFRLPSEKALINRLGFNGEGSTVVANRLALLRRGRPLPIPLGVNIGKTKLVSGDEATLDDYRTSYRRLAPHAGFIVVNVSSPNTPGLRQWQEKTKLRSLLSALINEVGEFGRPPLFLKISPDMTDGDLDDVVDVALDVGIAGIIATNTTVARPGDTGSNRETGGMETGGMSGRPLRSRANEVIRYLYRQTRGALPLIGVGGISTPEDVIERMRSGASLVQVYTALIYEGPMLPRTLNEGLLRLMDRDGIKSIGELVGTAA
jgi:dihydroorotate dehydrogenase